MVSLLAGILVGLLTLAAFAPVAGFPFLNWDDEQLFVRNDALRSPGVLAWAFTTRYMEHYQPIAWLSWAMVDRLFNLTPAAAHALNIVLHAACAWLVYLIARRLATGTIAGDSRGAASAGRGAVVLSCTAALFWSLHPLRVEAVAWASAMPYSLALAFGLTAALTWMNARPWTAVVLAALSLLARPIALGLPVVLWIVRRPGDRGSKVGLAMITSAAFGSALMESSARLTASLAELGIGARLTLAATAPWRYLWRIAWPSGLTPLDPLALTPHTDVFAIVAGLGATVLVTWAAWRWRRQYPVMAGAWVAYLVLLAPAMGIVPSGLQTTADRYTYVPAVPISIAVGYAIAIAMAVTRGGHRDRVTFAALARLALPGAAIAVLAAVTWQQTQHWRDSIALWTRAVDVDPRNDVALYNLASALAESDRRDEAIARYEAVLTLTPMHEASRRNRDRLLAQRFEEEGNRLASAGSLDAAIERYANAVRLDSRRTHSHAALGVSLVERARYAEARPHLEIAIGQGNEDPAVPNALAYALIQVGQREDAVSVLREAQRRHPGDANIARNLSRLMGQP